MRKLFPIILLPLAALSCVRADAVRPNVVVIIADDLGYGDLGCFGCMDIPTPNVDRLAADGVRFTQAYAYNVCSPSRASLLTGCYAERNGINTVLMGGNFPAFGKATTLAKVLHDSGYVTGLVGKWHLGYSGDCLPSAMGFDEVYGFRGGKIDYFRHTDSTQKNGTPEGRHDFYEYNTEIFPEGYSTELFTERARKFIQTHEKQPFYLQLAYNAPHYSTTLGIYQAPESYLKRFGVTGDPSHTRGGYAAMVACLDDGVGRVMEELRLRHLEENTLVIFISDNGAEEKGNNLPLSGFKHQNREGGIRVPWIARFPGRIPAGSVGKGVVHVMDLMPTLLSVTGTKPPEKLKFDGVDAWTAFTGKGAIPERFLCFPSDTVVNGRWKLYRDKLFDLEDDIAEKNDLAKRFPERVAGMKAALAAWQAEFKKKGRPNRSVSGESAGKAPAEPESAHSTASGT